MYTWKKKISDFLLVLDGNSESSLAFPNRLRWWWNTDLSYSSLAQFCRHSGDGNLATLCSRVYAYCYKLLCVLPSGWPCWIGTTHKGLPWTAHWGRQHPHLFLLCLVPSMMRRSNTAQLLGSTAQGRCGVLASIYSARQASFPYDCKVKGRGVIGWVSLGSFNTLICSRFGEKEC